VSSNPSTLLICARVLQGREAAFAEWQGRWQSALVASADASSVELWPSVPPDQQEVAAVARFTSIDALRRWRRGEVNRQLVDEAAVLVEGGIVMQLVGQAAVEYTATRGATMVMVTQIKPGKEAAYRAWANRIQKLQATFPGFIGSFVQPPQRGEVDWTTILRFDSAANLERWLKSDARAAMVKESEDLVGGFLAQRVDTSFPGWIPNDPATGAPPNMWKTACLVLLTLFPVVMLELRFLNPQIESLNPAVRTFIGNAISVGLTTWPLMPLAIFVFRDWLFPEGKAPWLAWALPVGLVLCYLVEIAVFWHLLL
jgi:antibiotic biosynthesis monooxygenase (ABM) superfamily enzyme